MASQLTTSSGCPGPHGSPAATRLGVPAQLRNLRFIRAAVRIALDGVQDDGRCERDVELAADELGAVLIRASPADRQLQLTINGGAQDVCVHMAVALAGPLAPAAPNLSRMVLDATCDYYDIRIGDRELSGEVQRARRHGLVNGALGDVSDRSVMTMPAPPGHVRAPRQVGA